MSNTSLLMQMMEAQPESPLSVQVTLDMLASAIATSLVLVTVTFLATRILDHTILGKTWDKPKDVQKAEIKEILGAINMLFLSVGVTGMMLLINNSLFRAFAILSAVALVKFRVKIDNKALNSSLLFGVLAGVSCGVREPLLAWTIVGTYTLLLGALLAVVKLTHRKGTATETSAVRWAKSLLAKEAN